MLRVTLVAMLLVTATLTFPQQGFPTADPDPDRGSPPQPPMGTAPRSTIRHFVERLIMREFGLYEDHMTLLKDAAKMMEKDRDFELTSEVEKITDEMWTRMKERRNCDDVDENDDRRCGPNDFAAVRVSDEFAEGRETLCEPRDEHPEDCGEGVMAMIRAKLEEVNRKIETGNFAADDEFADSSHGNPEERKLRNYLKVFDGIPGLIQNLDILASSLKEPRQEGAIFAPSPEGGNVPGFSPSGTPFIPAGQGHHGPRGPPKPPLGCRPTDEDVCLRSSDLLDELEKWVKDRDCYSPVCDMGYREFEENLFKILLLLDATELTEPHPETPGYLAGTGGETGDFCDVSLKKKAVEEFRLNAAEDIPLIEEFVEEGVIADEGRVLLEEISQRVLKRYDCEETRGRDECDAAQDVNQSWLKKIRRGYSRFCQGQAEGRQECPREFIREKMKILEEIRDGHVADGMMGNPNFCPKLYAQGVTKKRR